MSWWNLPVCFFDCCAPVVETGDGTPTGVAVYRIEYSGEVPEKTPLQQPVRLRNVSAGCGIDFGIAGFRERDMLGWR